MNNLATIDAASLDWLQDKSNFCFDCNTDVETLRIEAKCPIYFIKSEAKQTKIQIIANSEYSDEVEVSEIFNKKTIKIKHYNFECEGLSIHNGNISITGSKTAIHIKGDEILINGFFAGTIEQFKRSHSREPKICIVVPGGLSLNIDAEISGDFLSDVKFNNVEIVSSGKNVISFSAEEACIDDQYGAKITANIDGGVFNVSSTGNGEIVANGTYKKIIATLSDKASLKSDGICNGNYSINASDDTIIEHNGVINGETRKRLSGNSTANLPKGGNDQ